MGLIRVSDEAEARIKELAASSNKTVIATVDDLLGSSDIAKRLDYIQTRLDGLEGFLCPVGVKGVEGPKEPPIEEKPALTKTNTPRHPIPWDVMQELLFDYPLPDSAWVGNAKEEAAASNDMDFGQYYCDDKFVFSDDMWGYRDWLYMSQEIYLFLTKKGVL